MNEKENKISIDDFLKPLHDLSEELDKEEQINREEVRNSHVNDCRNRVEQHE
ncbi:MAG: hypothetical protein ACI39H_01560 [Lachnospiraceae bacterium]